MGITLHRVTVAEIAIATATPRREPFFRPSVTASKLT